MIDMENLLPKGLFGFLKVSLIEVQQSHTHGWLNSNFVVYDLTNAIRVASLIKIQELEVLRCWLTAAVRSLLAAVH